ncbi:SDR family NAD(P)-dependent oxidoreductase [Parapusillimonas granuli]|nr:SDR family NAD(P)-dependent oxidoreductase [Parapusillimonas granuli]MBB5215638.1 NAD(P)-dependent dehydrogenase (short-subunit alcohol dehydrogenase family) [Parapusillimonas granuli]
MLSMVGKVAFVTGAGSVGAGWGNGKATAVLLARQGASVFGVDVNDEALTATEQAFHDERLAQWRGLRCDVTDSVSVQHAVDECMARYGRIDILVNNVGGSAPGDPTTMTEDTWRAQIDLNLTSVFLSCKHVLPIMTRQFEAHGRGGAVVNVSSIGCMTFQVDGRVSSAYAASKAGVLAFSRSTAIAYVKKGVRVNTVIPGVMHTPLVEHRLTSQLGMGNAEELIARRHASVPIGKMGDAWDVAHAILFLASDEAGYITATELVVDGGITAARPTF